jgi:hypothetical protein
MTVSDAVAALWKAGYRANASHVMPGYVVVLDPVRCQRGSEPVRIEHARRVIHASSVYHFITERE